MKKLGVLIAAGMVLASPSFAQSVERCPSAGNAPDTSDHVYGCVPPVADSTRVQLLPTVPDANGFAVRIVGANRCQFHTSVASFVNVSVTLVGLTSV